MSEDSAVNQSMKRAAVVAVCVALGIGALSACEDDGDKSSRGKENAARQNGYDKLVANQPAKSVDYSPTRETKNFWIETWGKKPGKKSYVYIQDANGKYGYYILEGLPVSYCVSLLPPETKVRGDLGQYDGDMLVPGPSMDGTYSSGNDCSTKYGKDAESGAYVEFTVGTNQSYFLYSEPMDLPQYKDAQPLGSARIN